MNKTGEKSMNKTNKMEAVTITGVLKFWENKTNKTQANLKRNYM